MKFFNWDINFVLSIHFLEMYPDKIDMVTVCDNPKAIHIIEKNLQCIINGEDCSLLSSNPNAIHILKNHRKIIDWELLSSNPNIFELDNVLLHKEITMKSKYIDTMTY